MTTEVLEEGQTEQLTAEQVAAKEAEETASKLEAEELAAFEEGFAGAGEDSLKETPPKEDAKNEASNETPVENTAIVPDVPKTASLTEKQLADILGSVKSMEELKAVVESRFGSAFGKMGGLERTIRELQSSTTAGEAIVVKKEDLEDLTKEFPEVADHLAKDLTKVLSKIRGTRTGKAPDFDPESVKPLVSEEVKKTTLEEARKRELEDLTENFPTWNEIIGKPGSDTEYRKWLATQPAEYQTTVANSWRASTVGRSIERFNAYKEAQAKEAAKKKAPKTPAAASRAEILKEAVNQRGTPGFESGKSADDEFLEGFNGKR